MDSRGVCPWPQRAQRGRYGWPLRALRALPLANAGDQARGDTYPAFP